LWLGCAKGLYKKTTYKLRLSLALQSGIEFIMRQEAVVEEFECPALYFMYTTGKIA